MARKWQFVAVSIGPGSLVAAVAFSYAIWQGFFVSECDMKLGCSGLATIAALIGASALTLSSIGFCLGCIPHRAALQSFTAPAVIVAVAFLTVVVVLFSGFGLLLVPDSLIGVAVGGVVASAVASWLAVAALRWGLAPNNSFKPKPLRGSA